MARFAAQFEACEVVTCGTHVLSTPHICLYERGSPYSSMSSVSGIFMRSLNECSQTLQMLACSCV